MIYKLRPEWLEQYWGEARLHLGRLKDLDLDHARRLCARGEWQLWLAVNDGECLAAMITEVSEEPQKVITIVNAAGRDIETWEGPFLDRIDEWAAHMGASRVRVIGRKGWRRRLGKRGFTEAGIILEKANEQGR